MLSDTTFKKKPPSVLHQFEREVAADNMRKQLLSDFTQCLKDKPDQQRQCESEIAHSKHILVHALVVNQISETSLCESEKVQLQALRILYATKQDQPFHQTIFNMMCPDFEQQVRLEVTRFQKPTTP